MKPAAAIWFHSCGETPGEFVGNDACPLDADKGVMISLSDGGPLSYDPTRPGLTLPLL